MKLGFVILAVVFSVGIHGAWADPEAPVSPPAAASAPAPESATPVPAKAKAKATKSPQYKGARREDTEGTEAPDRFKADTAIQSKYQYDGKPLEADPD